MSNQPNGFIREDPWRVLGIMAEFVDAFETLSHLGPAVTIFGSARTKRDDRAYRATMTLARGLARNGLAVITGGGPGIMEAANKGAAEAGGKSVGLNIELPHEQSGNRYANVPIHFHLMNPCAPTVRWDTSPGQARDAGAALGQALVCCAPLVRLRRGLLSGFRAGRTECGRRSEAASC